MLIFKPDNLLDISLLCLIIVGLVQVGGAFFSGTKTEEYTNKNWVFVLMLVLGTFSFTIGVTGLFGLKYRRPTLYMLIPLWICTIIKVGFFYANSDNIISEGLLTYNVATFFKGFGIFEIVNKMVAIVLIA